MAFTLKSVDELFPTPLLRFEIGEAATLNAALLGEIATRRAGEEGVRKSNNRGWHSASDLFERKEPAQAKLAQLLLRMIAEATRTVAPETDFSGLQLVSDGWINVNPTGAYNGPHDHPGAFWSGCYYVQVPAGDGDVNDGAIEFISPHKPLPGLGLIGGGLTGDKLRIRPKPGLMLLWPANLLHWVHPNASAEDRVTIAFNGYFRRKKNLGGAVQNKSSRRPGGARPLS